MLQVRDFLSRHALDIALIIAVVAALAVDEVDQPHLDVPVLYVLVVAIAALRWNARPILVVVAAAAAVAFSDLMKPGTAATEWLGDYTGLMIVAFLALVLAYQRERARWEALQRQQVIHNVERLRQPLTVILGYAQLISKKSESVTATCQRMTATITREADKMRQILCDIVSEGAPPDH
jgi:signal transduction histidine kinase